MNDKTAGKIYNWLTIIE